MVVACKYTTTARKDREGGFYFPSGMTKEENVYKESSTWGFRLTLLTSIMLVAVVRDKKRERERELPLCYARFEQDRARARRQKKMKNEGSVCCVQDIVYIRILYT